MLLPVKQRGPAARTCSSSRSSAGAACSDSSRSACRSASFSSRSAATSATLPTRSTAALSLRLSCTTKQALCRGLSALGGAALPSPCLHTLGMPSRLFLACCFSLQQQHYMTAGGSEAQ